MSEYQRLEVNLDKAGIYCSYGTYKDTNDYCIFITRANGKSLLDYFIKKDLLELLNKNFETPFKNFDDFIKVNNLRISENGLGTFIVLRNMQNFQHYDRFNKHSYNIGLSFISKGILKFLALNLALYLKCKAIYSNNEIIEFAKNYNKDTKLLKEDIINKIENEVVNLCNEKNTTKEINDKKMTFDLYKSSYYLKLQEIIGKLNQEYENIGSFNKIKNEYNPAYLQKIDKVNFLKNNYFYSDTKLKEKFELHYNLVDFSAKNSKKDELIEKVTSYFKGEPIKENKTIPDLNLSAGSLCCASYLKENSFGIFLTNSNGKTDNIISTFYTDKFLKILNESFEEPYKSFDEFLEINNFKIVEIGDFKFIEIYKIKRDDKGRMSNYISGLSAFSELLALFFSFKLCKYVKYPTKKIYTNEPILNKISYKEPKRKNGINDETIKLEKENILSKIQEEVKKEEFEYINLDKLGTIFKTKRLNFNTVKFTLTKTYENLEKITKHLKENDNIEVETIDNKNNLAYF